MTSVFSSTIAGKAWFATAAVLLALVQVLTAARIFGHLQGVVRLPHPHGEPHPPLVGSARVPLHAARRLPLHLHPRLRLGDPRTLAHSIAGSFVYGVFAVKIFFVHDHDHPRWTLPLVGRHAVRGDRDALADVRLLVLHRGALRAVGATGDRSGSATHPLRDPRAGCVKMPLYECTHCRSELPKKANSPSGRSRCTCTARRRW